MPTLDWIGKSAVMNHDRQVPLRTLRRVPSESYGAEISGNVFVHGDNLHALKALLPHYSKRVRCIYIDPPYNTGEESWVYSDSVDSPAIRKWLGQVVGPEAEDLSRHDKWLCMMYPRLKILKEFLSNNGSLWIQLDDNEIHSGREICDELFGRENFEAQVVWQKRTSPDNRLKISRAQDYILIYARDRQAFEESANLIPPSAARLSAYKNPDNDPRGPWASRDITGQEGHAVANQFYTIVTPGGRERKPASGRCWSISEPTFKRLVAENRIWFGRDGNAVPRLKLFREQDEGVSSWTWWPNSEVGHNQEAKKELNDLFGENLFQTPKPERLIRRILEISTNPGDLVLDSFAGSGTTGAVAHKMGRRWIMVELEDHYKRTILPRLRKVIDGDDPGGITSAVGWQGGGGYDAAELGSPMFDDSGLISADVTFTDLARYLHLMEFGMPMSPGSPTSSPLIGVDQGRALFLLFNGILGDRRPNSGNILTRKVLAMLPPCDERVERLVYGEGNLLGPSTLAAERITFKQLPYRVPVL